MPITLDLDAGQGNSPMYLVVQLGRGFARPPIPPIHANDPARAVAQRIGGYWPMGLNPGKKADRVHQALGAGRPVFVIATWMARVIKVMQVSVQPSMPIGNPETDVLDNSFVPLANQPALYQWPGQDGAVWACRYMSPEVGTKTRIMLAPTNDAVWLGQQLVWGNEVTNSYWNYTYSTGFPAPLP
jgi:hypothetical protein